MKKFLDILIIALLTVLLLQLIGGDNNKKISGELGFEIAKNSYSVPADIILNISNNTSEQISINTCNDITINKSGNKLELSESFCRDLSLNSGEKISIDYSSEYSKFQDIGDYVFKLNLLEKEYIDGVEVKHKGTISKLFTAVFYAPLYNLMIYLTQLTSMSLGWGIIIITIILRLVLLYPQHKMMVSQKRLQALQPKIQKIQKEFKGNQQMLGMKMMELYKKENVNPMGSCGFLLIQMPILIVLYHIILNVKDISNEYHLYSFLKGFDLSAVNYNFFGLDLLGAGGISGLILALTVGIIQFIQIKLSLDAKKADTKGVVLEKKDNSSPYSQFMPDPDMMNKFMLYGMPAMVAVFTFTLIAGVGIYWGISTLFMLFQQLFVNKILKK